MRPLLSRSRKPLVFSDDGDDAELALIADTIRGVVARANKVGSGLNIWLDLRTYPAVLLMTAYGLGLARAERWKTLHDLFSLSMPRDERDPKRLVNSLFLWDWRGSDDNLWNNVEGFTTGNNRRKTPLSDHLFDVSFEWGTAFLGVPTDNALLFDRFEALGALVHLEENSERALKDQLENGDRKARMSVGRIGWRSEGRRSIEHELKSTPTRQQLLKAGFALGSEAYLDLFLENLSRVARWMEWR